MKKLSVYITSDSVVDYLGEYLKKISKSQIEYEIGPYNQVNQILLSEAKSQSIFLWTAPDVQIPSFSKLLTFEPVNLNIILKEVEQFASQINHACREYEQVFMLSWIIPEEFSIPLALATKSKEGPSDVLSRINIHLSELLKGNNNFHLIDQSILSSRFTNPIHDPRLYAMARIRYSLDYIEYIAEKVTPIIKASVTASKKLIICDLDNTLWNGIVGDDGLGGIKIGSNDPLGEAHLQMQKALKALKNRGILLAISSKNNLNIALEAIEKHPNMLLKKEDFVAKEINWNDKAANILKILSDLNLHASSAIFLDDNPTERDRVKKAIPDILVPDLPQDVSEWAGIINSLDCFETLSTSNEDKERSKTYIDESKRRNSSKLFGNIEDWLVSLELVLKVEQLNKNNLQRSTQLLNKTNQFNLSTRRMSENELSKWSENSQRFCLTFSVSDRYGDSGLTAFVSIEKNLNKAKIIDFVMSCRVMGKGIEDAILSQIIKNREKMNIYMETIPSDRNLPIQEFCKKVAPNGIINKEISCPKHIKIIEI